MKLSNRLLLIVILIAAAVLRFYALDRYPAGLNADEAALGYNAWSLLETGRDEHNASWPLVFRSFDDYKPPLYVYLTLPFVKFFGLTVWAVRLPSAIFGLLAVWGVFLLTRLLFPKSPRLALLSALVLALSPWHLHFSRGGWEVNTAATLALFGLVFCLSALSRPVFFIPSALAFVLSLYTYHSLRLILPLLGLSLLIIYFQPLKSKIVNHKSYRQAILISLTIGFILLFPLAVQMLSPSGQSRFSGVSVFADTGPYWEAVELRTAHHYSRFARYVHNQYVTYAFRFAKNYLSHFSPRFQFVIGDDIARSKVPGMGQWYLLLFPFFALGLYRLFRLWTPGARFLAAWLLISPLAAALTFQSPHALRAQNMVIPMAVIMALGIYHSARYLYRRRALFAAFILLLSLTSAYEVSRYLHLYYVHYPKELPYAWQYGFDQIAAYVLDHQDEYDQIIISDRYDQPYILLAFFMRYPPSLMQQQLKMEPRDKFGFSTAREIGKLHYRSIDFINDINLPRTLLVVTNEPVPDSAVPIHTITFPDGGPGYRFYSTQSL